MIMTSADQYSAENIHAYEFTDQDQQQQIMHEVLEPVVFTASSGQEFSGSDVNRDATGPAIVRVNAFHSASSTRQQKYTVVQYALANPNNRVLAIDFPSHGKSSRLTIRQRLEMIEDKTMAKVANAQANAVARYLPDQTDYIGVGESIGGQVLPDFIRALGANGLNPLLMIGLDVTGVNTFSKSKSAKKQVTINRFQGHAAYHEGEANERLDAAYKLFSEQLDAHGYADKEYDVMNLLKRDPLLFATMVGVSPVKSTTTRDSLNAALKENPDLQVAMVSGGLSRMCDWSKIAGWARRTKDAYPDRFDWDVWPNDSHSMGIAEQQPRFAAFTKAQIEKL